MKKKIFLFKIFTCLACAATASMALDSASLPFSTYMGVEAGYRNTPFAKNMGAGLIPKKYPQGGIFAGVRLYDYFGFELGYKRTTHKERLNPLMRGEGDVLTLELDPADFYQPQFEGLMSSFYGDLLAYFPVSEDYRLELIGAVGMSRLRYKMKMNLMIYEPTPPNILDSTVNLMFKEKIWMPKLALGIQHMLNSDFGLRLMFSWEQTAKLKQMHPTNLRTGLVRPQYSSTMKNSITPSIGMFYSF